MRNKTILLLASLICSVGFSPAALSGDEAKPRLELKMNSSPDSAFSLKEPLSLLRCPDKKDDKERELKKIRENLDRYYKESAKNKAEFEEFSKEPTELYITTEKLTLSNSRTSGFTPLPPLIVFPGNKEKKFLIGGDVCTAAKSPSGKIYRLTDFYLGVLGKVKTVNDSEIPKLKDQIDDARQKVKDILDKRKKQAESAAKNNSALNKQPETQQTTMLSQAKAEEKALRDAQKEQERLEQQIKGLGADMEYTRQVLEILKDQFEIYGAEAPAQ